MQSFYKEIVLDHFQRPRNRHELEHATIEEHIDNPLCGDHVTVYANVHDDTLEEVSFTGRGCSISQASASMLTEQLTGASRNEAEQKIQAFLQMMQTRGKRRPRRTSRPQRRHPDPQPHQMRHPGLGSHATRPRIEWHQA